MDTEVMRPPPLPPSTDTPYITASSTPFSYSTPTSPTHISSFSEVPFHWEQKPGISKSHIINNNTPTSSNYGDAEEEQNLQETDFEFDFSGQLERTTSSADELFQGGQIKPLKPPPRLYPNSPKSPKSPKNLIKEAFSPRPKKNEFDPFAAAMDKTREDKNGIENRGRDQTGISSNTSCARHKKTRSLSPYRVSDLLIDPEFVEEPKINDSFFSSWYKRWKIKDLLLFRSASESRATDKDQLKKFALLKKNREDDKKSSSCRSTESVGSVSSRRRSGPPITPHELHYTMNRAVSEEMKRRTYLPYKQGLLGCLKFHPNGLDISRRFD